MLDLVGWNTHYSFAPFKELPPNSFVEPYVGTLLNGDLHWLVQPHDTSTFICSFDIEKEEFQPFPGPPIQDWVQIGILIMSTFIWVLQEVFSISIYVRTIQLLPLLIFGL